MSPERQATPPRIRPMPLEDVRTSGQELLDATLKAEGRPANIFTTVVRSEGLLRRWLPLVGKLLNGKIPFRDRELVVLRTAWNCGTEYEWSQHVLLGLESGLSLDEIADIAKEGVEGWGERDALLLRAADELHATWTISDPIWERLTGIYDGQQLIEFPLLVGHYHMAAMLLNALKVELDPGMQGFPVRSTP